MKRPGHVARSSQHRMTNQRSELEEGLAAQLKVCKVEGWVREYRFCAHHVGLGPGIRNRMALAQLKDWRFDFAWPGVKLAVECEGGGWVGGGHNRGQGFADDLQKYHSAAVQGWVVYRCDLALINSARSVGFIQQYLKGCGNGCD